MPENDLNSSGSNRGLVMVITGDGKGKTTSAFGQALRALGQGYRICIIQFMKNEAYGEIQAIKRLLPENCLFQFGRDGFIIGDDLASADIELARQGLQKAREIVESREFDMVILDEINIIVHLNLAAEEDVLELIKNKKPELDLVLTGRYATENIMQAADMVSVIIEVKHHYNAGIKSRAGIEY
ncbi:MAG: cob(I)yrinic acid a,c-diamide adenosyltransferase [Syntrophomonas sp.]